MNNSSYLFRAYNSETGLVVELSEDEGATWYVATDEQLAEFGNRFEIETESGDVFEVEVEVEEEHDEEYCEDCKSKFN